MDNNKNPKSIDEIFKLFLTRKQEHTQIVDNEQPAKELKCDCTKNIIVDNVTHARVCGKCGAEIISSAIDPGAEWRNFNNTGVSNVRCHPVNSLLPVSSLSTTITCAYGAKQPSWVKHSNWGAIPSFERRLLCVYRVIDKMENVPKGVLNRAKYYMKIILENKVYRGNPKNGLIGAAIYFVCKESDISLTHRMISEQLNVNKKAISDGCKLFLKLLYDMKKNVETLCQNPEMKKHNIISHCDMLSLPYDLSFFVIKLIKCIDIIGCLQNSAAISIEAGSLHFAAQHKGFTHVTKENIRDVCEVSVVTITNVCKILNKYATTILASCSQY